MRDEGHGSANLEENESVGGGLLLPFRIPLAISIFPQVPSPIFQSLTWFKFTYTQKEHTERDFSFFYELVNGRKKILFCFFCFWFWIRGQLWLMRHLTRSWNGFHYFFLSSFFLFVLCCRKPMTKMEAEW